MAAQYPGAQNTFVPSHEASNSLVVNFSRDASKFAVNKYTQITPVKQVMGYYLKMTIEQAGRILNTDLKDFIWPDGMPAREGNDETESHEFLPFKTVRYLYPVMLGDLTIDQASWNILEQYSRIQAQRAMTARTQAAINVLTNTANYDAAHRLDVTAISQNSGRLDQSTTARQDIKRTLHTAAELIMDATLATVGLGDLQFVINSSAAAKLARCQEIVDYIKGSPDASAMVKGELKAQNPNVDYGLPPQLYGVPLVVEATRKVTSRKGASRAASQVLTESTPFICARPGELEGVEGAPSFSTCTGFFQEEMTVETKRDPDNRRTQARIVENFQYVQTAPATGVLFSNAF